MNERCIGLKPTFLFGIVLVMCLSFLPTVYAAGAADMPWDSVLETLVGDVTVSGGSFTVDTTGGELTHTLPLIVLTVSIAMTGLLLMFGESSGMARTTLNIIFCTSMVLLIGSWFNSNFFSVTALADPLTEGRVSGVFNLAAGAEVMFGGIVLACMVMKLPNLVAGLMNGSPSLGSGDLFEPVKSAGNMAASVKSGGISQIAKMQIAKDMAGSSGMAAVLGQRLRNAVATTGPRAAYKRQTMAAQEKAAERMHKSGLAWGDGRYKNPHTYDGAYHG